MTKDPVKLWTGPILLLLAFVLCSTSWTGAFAETGNKDNPIKTNLTYEQSHTFADGEVISTEKVVFDTFKNVRSGTTGHPLTSNITSLFDYEEFAIGSLIEDEDGEMRIFDDKTENFKVLGKLGYGADVENAADMVAGDIDGDLRDELILAYEIESMENGQPVTKTLVSFFDDGLTEFKALGTWEIWVTDPNLASGDLDGDGLDEVALVGNLEGGVFMGGVIFDDLLAAQPIYHEWMSSPNATIYHDIVAADLDGDGIQELATVGYENDTLVSMIWKWNSSPGVLPSATGVTLAQTLPVMYFTIGLPSISSGDIDGDGLGELIITTHDENFNIHYRIHDDMLSDFAILKDVRDENITLRNTDSATGDLDGDGIDEIILVGHHVANLVGRILDDANHNYTVLKTLDFIWNDNWYYWFNLRAKTGDVDGDGIDELVLTGQSWWQIHTEVYDDLFNTNGTMMKRLVFGWKIPSLAMGDFDGDGLVLEYTGEHNTIETPPIPIIALAAPPIIADSSQETESSLTRFGITGAESSNNAYQLNVTSEVSISFEGEPMIISGNVRSALLAEFAETQTPIAVSTNNISFEGKYPDNHIIYHNTTYESYTYRILEWPGQRERVGENITINIPLSMDIGYMTQTYYNNMIATGIIGNETFIHEPGNIATYSTSAQRNRTLDQHHGWNSKSQHIAHGTDSTNIILNLGQIPGFGMKWELIDWRDDGFESTIGLSSDLCSEITIGENTVFEGLMGNFQNKREFENQDYSIGMFAYQLNNTENGQTYLVVDYWVEGSGQLTNTETTNYTIIITSGILATVIVLMYFINRTRKKKL